MFISKIIDIFTSGIREEKNMIAIISADIVRSTSLQTEDLIALRNRLRALLDELGKEYPGFWARIVRGDSIECVVPDYRLSLRIAVLLKLFVKVEVDRFDCQVRLKRHGIRFSIGIGDTLYADQAQDIINGPAIVLSGRNLDRIDGKDQYAALEAERAPGLAGGILDAYVALVSNLVGSYSSKQAEVVFHKLRGLKEVEIARLLGIGQSAVNMRSTGAQWSLLHKAVDDFERLDLENKG